jgi:hypothetical protein
MLALLLATAPTVGDPLGVSDALPDKCTSADAQEVVVCGSREKSRRYRVPKLERQYEQHAIRLETSIVSGVRGSIHVDPIQLPGGAKSNRIMITVGTSF